MINLLPPEEQSQLRLEDARKLVIILGITIIIPLICLALVLLSIQFYILGEINSQKTVLEQTKAQYQTQDFLKTKQLIDDSNAAMGQLIAEYQKNQYLGKSITAISVVPRPAGLYITDLSLVRESSGMVQATMTGFSNSRDDLLTFQKNLQSAKEIQNPVFSPESWVPAANVKFSLTFSVLPS
jgi:hypothetical protein